MLIPRTLDPSLSIAPLYGTHGIKLSYKIERLERAAARYAVNGYDFTSSVTEILKTLHWQTLEERIQKSLVMLDKKNRNLVVVDHRHPIVSRNLDFQVPYSRTQYQINSFSQEPSDPGIPFIMMSSSTSIGQFTAGL